MSSRDFRAETLYFVFIDRFCNADPDNDPGEHPEGSDPTRRDWRRYWGGDLQGVLDKLEYLDTIGVSALWLSPVFEQIDGLADDRGQPTAPYHGYWPKDWRQIDEHLLPRTEWHRPFADRGTVLDRLIAAAHARRMRIFLDAPCNGSSPSGSVPGKGALHDDRAFLTSFADDRLGWYHREGPIRDWGDPEALERGELYGVADLNEEVWTFRHYIMETMAAWLDRGVDGFRLDAVKHMALSFWQEVTATLRKRKRDVVLFGEWAGGSSKDARAVHFANTSGMSVLDFEFQRAAQEVLCAGQHFSRLAEVFHHDHVYEDATELVTFLDNQDMPRLLSCGLPAAQLPLALALLLTARGVPCVYYGTEQGLHDDTNGGGDPYNRPMMERWDLDTPAPRALARLAALRRRSLALQRGYTRDLLVEQDLYAYVRSYGRSAVLVVLNRGPEVTRRLDATLLPDGNYHDLLQVLEQPIEVRSESILSLTMPAGAALVLEATTPPPSARAVVLARLSGYATRPGERVVVLGDAPELGRWDPARAVSLCYVNQNQWTGDLLFDESAGQEVLYRYAVIDAGGRLRREDRLPRSHQVVGAGHASWKDRWER